MPATPDVFQSQNVDLKDLTNKIIEDGRLDPLLVNNLMDTEKMVFMLPHCGECVEEGYPSNTVGSILRVTNLINWQVWSVATIAHSSFHSMTGFDPAIYNGLGKLTAPQTLVNSFSVTLNLGKISLILEGKA